MSTSETVITKEDYGGVKGKEGADRKKRALYMSPNAQEIGQIYAKGDLHAFVFTSISCEKICCTGQTQFYVGKANLQGLGQNTSISMDTWVNKSYLPCY